MPKPSKKKNRPELSKNLMRMKFMKRGAGGSDSENEKSEALESRRILETAKHGEEEQTVLDEDRWVLGELPAPAVTARVSDGLEIVEEPNFTVVCGQLWNRMSFGGFNRLSERIATAMNAILLGEEFCYTGKVQDGVDVDDEAMAAFHNHKSSRKRRKNDSESDDDESDAEEGEIEDEELTYATTSRVDHLSKRDAEQEKAIAAWSDDDEDEEDKPAKRRKQQKFSRRNNSGPKKRVNSKEAARQPFKARRGKGRRSS